MSSSYQFSFGTLESTIFCVICGQFRLQLVTSHKNQELEKAIQDTLCHNLKFNCLISLVQFDLYMYVMFWIYYKAYNNRKH